MRRSLLLTCLLVSFIPSLAAAQRAEYQFEYPRDKTVPGGELEFRAMIHYWGINDYDRVDQELTRWADEGYNTVIWGFSGEGWGGSHGWIRHEQFPEARELSDEEIEARIANIKKVFGRANELGMKNLLYAQSIFFTKAFGEAHDLLEPSPPSPTVHEFHSGGYGGDKTKTNLGLRNELVDQYMQELFRELLTTYEHLDGFYSPIGEAVPGDRGLYYREVIAPVLRESDRKPLMIAHQWQVPLETYRENIAPKDIYDNTWLAYHAWNSEQITSPEPSPGMVYWAKRIGLPTVATVYPANCQTFPWNSPLWAWDIAQEMRKIPNFVGFAYFELSSETLSPLFRKALAYYTEHNVPYSDEPWLAILTEQYGDEQAAEHFLNAFKASANIYPEVYALAYSGSDYARKELRLPYYMLGENLVSGLTAPERGGILIPVTIYARTIAAPGNRERYEDSSGDTPFEPPYRQEAIWGSQGGSFNDIIPPDHMQNVRKLGETAAREAEAAMPYVKDNQEEAQRILNFMRAYELMARYFERKVMAGIYAQVYARTKLPEDRAKALAFADETLEAYEDAVAYMKEHTEPQVTSYYGKSYNQHGRDLDGLLEDERKERQDIGVIFQWPDPESARE